MHKIQLVRAAVATPPLALTQFDAIRAICGPHVAINGPYGDGHMEIVWSNQTTQFLEKLHNQFIPALEEFFNKTK